MQTFQLHRDKDVSGVSGEGVVAEGVEFADGTVVLRWLTRYSSIAIYEDIDTLLQIHSHRGATYVEYASGWKRSM